jgi:restriction system protein
MKFKVKAIDSNNKKVNVEIDAEDRKSAISSLRTQGFLVLEVIDESMDFHPKTIGSLVLKETFIFNVFRRLRAAIFALIDTVFARRIKHPHMIPSVTIGFMLSMLFAPVLSINYDLFGRLYFWNTIIIMMLICLIWYYFLRPYLEAKTEQLSKELEAKTELLNEEFYKNREKEKISYLKQCRREISKHAKELSIRRNQLTVQRNYGLIDDKKWKNEVNHFILNVIKPLWDDDESIHYLQEVINEVTDNYQSTTTFFSIKMSPSEYEQLVTNTLSTYGWDARMTVASGDQGIDVIAKKQDIKVVIQCKLYSNNVGNAAVQEIIAGKTFEKADFAVVVSNADFTSSAKQLASSSGVLLMHHDQLANLETMCLS